MDGNFSTETKKTFTEATLVRLRKTPIIEPGLLYGYSVTGVTSTPVTGGAVSRPDGGLKWQKSTSGVSKMDAQRPIYPQRVRKKSVGPIAHRRPTRSKIDIGSIKNGCAASDLPPEGQKKESWAIFSKYHQIEFRLMC